MIFLRVSCIFTGLLVVAANLSCAAAANTTTSFQEVYGLIRSNVTGLSEAELNQAAIEGLVNALAPRVTLVSGRGGTSATGLLAQATIFDRDIAYLRVERVNAGLDKAIQTAYRSLSASNEMKGVVLDLRYADGDDYASAAATADLFISKEQSLLKWGNQGAVARAKTNAISVPVAVLVNRGTVAAAEALAAVLRQSGTGLVIGSHTAGRGMVTEDFPLANGSTLRVATQPVLLGNGERLPKDGVAPDISVTVPVEDERAYYADAFHLVRRTNLMAEVSGTAGTNGTRRARFNEAELVREHRGGLDRSIAVTPQRPVEPETPVVSDPALARALDLIRGLAVVRQSRL